MSADALVVTDDIAVEVDTAAPPTITRSPLSDPKVMRVLLVLGLVAPLVCARAFSEFADTVLVQVMIAAIAVAGLHLLVHWTGQISLAQVAFMGIGAMVTARANADFGVPLPLAIVVGVAGAVVASLAIGLPALRIRGFALAIITLAFGFAATRWLFLRPWLVPLAAGLPIHDRHLFGFDVTQSRQLIIPIGIIGVAVIALTTRLGSSPVGRSLRMVARDEEVAAAYGIRVAAHKLFAFLYAGACAGLAGAFMVISIGRVGPGAFPPTRSVLYLGAVLFGGPGPLVGPLQAAAGFAAFPVLFRSLGRYVDLIGPLSILLVVTVSPAGINGVAAMAETAIARRLHRRKAHATPEDGS
jgi:branched-chain amino acid transport system permease protein